MTGKKNQWFNIYYLIIILLCLMVGLFIWFLFSIKISSLDTQDETASSKDKKASVVTEPRVESLKHLLKGISVTKTINRTC